MKPSRLTAPLSTAVLITFLAGCPADFTNNNDGFCAAILTTVVLPAAQFGGEPGSERDVSVRITDRQQTTDVPAAGIEVAFGAVDPFTGYDFGRVRIGAGSWLKTVSTTTDPAGITPPVTWSFGSYVGEQKLLVMLCGADPINAHAFASGRVSAPVAHRLELTQGPAANGTVGGAGQIVATVKSAYNLPVADHDVTFEIIQGGGSFAGIQGTTAIVRSATASGSDPGGKATAPVWFLGTTPGLNEVRIAAIGLTGSPIQVLVMTQAGAPNTITRTTADPQQAVVSSAVAAPPAVRVDDAFQNPLPNVSVVFAVGPEGGAVEGSAQVTKSTNAQGIAALTAWTVGSQPGTYRVTATASGSNIANNPLTFTATAVLAPGLTLTKQSADPQTTHVDVNVPAAPRVRITDAQGNGVAGIPVSWTVTQLTGDVNPNQPTTTDGNGYASLQYFTPTSVGTVKLRASTGDPRVSPQFVEFTITSTP